MNYSTKICLKLNTITLTTTYNITDVLDLEVLLIINNTINLKCGIYNGMCQYGKITVWSKGGSELECHIHNFNKEIYGETLKITDLEHVKHPFASKEKHCKLAKIFM